MKRFYKRGISAFLCVCLLLLSASMLVPAKAQAEQGSGQRGIVLETPALKSIHSVDYQHINLSWEAVEGADFYRIYRKTSGTSWKRVADKNAVSYTDKVKTGVLYDYTVRACVENEDGSLTFGKYDKTGICAKAVPSAPSIKAKSSSWNSIGVSWGSVAGASGYRVYIKTTEGWKKTGTYKSSVRSAKIGDLTLGSTYTFTVRAYTKTDSGNVWGKYKASGVKAKPAFSVPKLEQTVSTGGGIRIAWSKVDGAHGYRLYRKLADDARWKKLADVKGESGTAYMDRKCELNTEYYYTVRAYREVDSEIIYGSYDKTGVAGIRVGTIDPDKPMVALTYDDGPSVSTPAILDILEKYDARATFFVVGDRIDGNSRYQSYVKRAVDLGCQIGNHTYEHKTLTSLSAAQIQSQISKCDAAVNKAAGVIPSIMRPPGGARNSTVDQAVGKPLILWSIDTLDWKTRDSSSTISAVLDDIRDGDIVLMHDLYSATAEASKTIIPSLIKKGYQLVTVEELAACRGGMEKGKRYSSFRP